MATLKTKRQADGTQLVPITDLTGGIDLRQSPTLLAPNRARRLLNFSLEEPGALQPVPGWQTFSATSLGAGRVQAAQRIYLDGATFTLAMFGGSVYKPSDAGVWGSAVLSGLHGSNLGWFQYDRDFAAVFDRDAVPQKTANGTDWTQLGITAPTVAPTLAAVAGGSLISGNQLEVSFAYRDTAGLLHTSNGGPSATVTPSGGNLSITVECPFSADPQVDTIVAYVRDTTAGDDVRREAGTVANPGSGTATITITSRTWASAEEVPTDNGVAPEGLQFGFVWKNRWWAIVGSRIYFTQLFQNQSWPEDFYLDIPFARGDDIASGVSLGDQAVIFGASRQAFVIIGHTSLDFEVRPVPGVEAGAFGPYSAMAIEGGIAHAAAEGVYVFDGASDRLLSHDLDGRDGGWRSMVSSASASDLQRIPLMYHRARKELRIGAPQVFPYAFAGEWLLNLDRSRREQDQHPTWTATDRPAGIYVHWDGPEATTGNRGRLFSCALTTGQMFEEALADAGADGGNLTCEYEGPALTTGLTNARFTALHGEYRPADGTFGAEILCDGISVGTLSIDISGDLDRYGTAEFGSAVYGGASRLMFAEDLPLEAEGRTISVRAQYVGKDRFQWFGYGVMVAPESAIRGIA